MKQDKELLLKDLCARLPHNVKIHAKYTNLGETIEVDGIVKMIDGDGAVGIEVIYDTSSVWTYIQIDNVKPYLFPLSSMTDEQQEEFDRIYADDMQVVANNLKNRLDGKPYETNLGHYRHIDWLNANHFDYRGLIPIGLAIDATGLNIY